MLKKSSIIFSEIFVSGSKVRAVSFGSGKVIPGVFHVKHGQTGGAAIRFYSGPTGYQKPE